VAVTEIHTKSPSTPKARLKIYIFQPHHLAKIMARQDKSALVTSAVEAFQRGDFATIPNAAAHFKVNPIAIRRRIRGVIKRRQEANNFYHKCLTTT
jgi:hypothetical protein